MPPHEHLHHALHIRNEDKIKPLLVSFGFSSLFATIFALALSFFEISISVIVPSTAPVWMGTLTLSYMVQSGK